jgi:DNA invertase Pin-like site-specific DNA recombinase
LLQGQAGKCSLMTSENQIITAKRAAQYVRMSTDMQKYSIENQADAIADYAARHQLTVVRTYADEGRSGLDIDRRSGLRSLIDDVEKGCADYEAILVYDVSRWGRFQDVDESAYYEFICKEAGISVRYCAEQFENDGSLASTILKTLKRAMAGEYSRELSVKVFIGQCRIVRMGFWRGGESGYGLRRQLLDERGRVRATLESGQRKFLQTDRTVLIPGPAHEARIIERIFKSFALDEKGPTQIAEELNAERLRNIRGNEFSSKHVRDVLQNEKYIGNIIYNRTSFKLKQKRVINPPEMWVRQDAAVPPLVAPDIFAKAQQLIAERRTQRTDQEVLDRLAALGREKGHLTRAIIAASEGLPSTELYRRRFGSLMAAYRLAGYEPDQRRRRSEVTKKRFRALLDEMTAEIVRVVGKLEGTATIADQGRLININDELLISVRLAAAVMEGAEYRNRWRIHTRRKMSASLTLIARMTPSNLTIDGYYLLPASKLEDASRRSIYLANPVFAEASRYDDLESFCRHCVGAQAGGEG